MFNRNSGSVPSSGGSRPGQLGASQGFVKVRLPMQSTNGKRPVVELVMLTNGKYQPIKFTNNRSDLLVVFIVFYPGTIADK